MWYRNRSLSAPETAELLQIVEDILAEGIPPSKGTTNILYISTILVVYLTPLPSGCALLRLHTGISVYKRLEAKEHPWSAQRPVPAHRLVLQI